MRFVFTVLSLIPFFSFGNPPEEKVTVSSILKSATVYRNGAELMHNASAMLKQGNNELVIDGLSSYMDINSIRVNCPAAVTILGMEFNNNYLGEEVVSPSAKKLKDSMEFVNAEIKKYDIQININNDLLDVLQQNKSVKGEQTGLSVAELIKLMSYYEQKSLEVQEKQLALNDKKLKLQTLYARLSGQLAEEQKKNTKIGGRLILQLSVAMEGQADFSVTYFTTNAFWTPYYDVKAENINRPLKFIYKAKIAQTTGIDWKKVKLSLSTSTPTQFGNAPILKTWFLSYIDPYRAMNQDLKANSIQSALAGRVAGAILDEVVVTGYSNVKLRGSNAMSSGNQPIYIVNGNIMPYSEFSKISPQAIASTEVLTAATATAIYGSQASSGAIVVTLKNGLDDYVTVSSSELDITYDIDIPYDVPTNGKQQIATLQQTSVPATYKYYAVPKLDKEAFLLAEIANWQTLNLLPGEANVIFENTYIGKTFIDPANTNDTLNLTLGTDKRVVVKREKLVDFSSTKLIGANKVQTITYDITIKNSKKEPINIILKDQYPISTTKEIEVELLESSAGSVNEEIGVVTWQKTIQPGQNTKVRISYSAKYPKGKSININ